MLAGNNVCPYPFRVGSIDDRLGFSWTFECISIIPSFSLFTLQGAGSGGEMFVCTCPHECCFPWTPRACEHSSSAAPFASECLHFEFPVLTLGAAASLSFLATAEDGECYLGVERGRGAKSEEREGADVTEWTSGALLTSDVPWAVFGSLPVNLGPRSED